MGSEDSIIWLNTIVCARLAPSSIHGIGVFAIKDIQKGNKLHLDDIPVFYKISYGSFSKFLSHTRQLILERWPKVIVGSGFLYPEAVMTAYLNHSESANYDALTDVALGDIIAGEEITENYRRIPNYEKVFPWLSTPSNEQTM